jgi:CheY-like chemotaxis protein
MGDLKKKILLVDDNSSNLFLLKHIIKSSFDFDITEETLPVKALETIKNEHFDLAILDVFMPQMNGNELAVEIKKIEQYKSLPIFFLTADESESETVRECLKIPDTQVLNKPINKAILVDSIEKAINP